VSSAVPSVPIIFRIYLISPLLNVKCISLAAFSSLLKSFFSAARERLRDRHVEVSVLSITRYFF
jgi:hypothetical protein